MRANPLHLLPRTESDVPVYELTLIHGAITGDTLAQDQLYRRHAPCVYGLLFRLMGGSHDVEDVLQDTFVAAFDDLASLRDPHLFSAWLRQVAVRQAHKRFRRRRLERWLKQMPYEAVSLVAISRADLTPHEALELSRIDEALSGLSADLRTAWFVRHVEGCTLEETAMACDCSLATIKRRLQRAEARVDRRLGITRSAP
jgi:RNA polymerase sigma-70 factor (ECF subfamily)